VICEEQVTIMSAVTTTKLQRYSTAKTDAVHPLALVRCRPEERTTAPPVILLHGSTLPGSIAYSVPLGGRSWLDDLATRGRDAWALDVRGYGLSWKPDDDRARPSAPVADTAQAVEDLTAAIHFVMRETGTDVVDLIGWSWGATVAASYAALARPLGRMVLHAPQWLRDTPSPMVTPATMSEPYRAVDAVQFVDRWLARVDDASRDVMIGWRATFERALSDAGPITVPNGSARDIASQWMAGKPGYDPARITAPTLVIVGAADVDTPPALARAVFDRIGATEKLYVEVPNGTHFTPLEPARDDLFRITAAFLAATPS
jgi:pimeloyl-ACP methyl ester carboxylesterase